MHLCCIHKCHLIASNHENVSEKFVFSQVILLVAQVEFLTGKLFLEGNIYCCLHGPEGQCCVLDVIVKDTMFWFIEFMHP